jgi:Carboxypeptidase regulatory-like domain/TonB-dependent Receptor Plug Domain/TonB dependent receptor
MKTTGRLGVYLLALAGLFGCGAAWGQTNGSIRGVVNDPSGAVVPGATVTATLNGTDSQRSAISDKDGAFDIPELAVGTYDVTAEAQGFKKFVAKAVVVSIGHVNFITVTFQVGATNDTVTVEANAVQVETTSTQLGAVMTDQSIRELPLNSRNAYALLQLQPGVQSQLGADLFAGSSNPGVVSVNGGRGRSNNYMVNGGDGNDIFVNGPAIQPSPDAIEEFRVLTNTFDAEYGRNSGSVVNVVTKSGTNTIHGDFYDFLRNDALNTRGYFDNSIAPYKQNQFGGTLGGPIKKDKTFIFGSYEGNRLTQGISTGTVLLPTSAEAAGDFSEGTGTAACTPQGTTPPPGSVQCFGGSVADAAFATLLQSRPGCTAAIAAQGGAAPVVGNSYGAIFRNNVNPGGAISNQIPTACFDPTALALYNKYILPLGTGSFSAVPASTADNNQFTVRFDQKITGSQQFSAYYYFENDANTQPISSFQGAGGNIPGFGALFGTRVQQWNLSHTWTISSSAVNEFRFNYFREGQQTNNHPVNTLAAVQDSCGAAVAPANCFSVPGNPSAGITTDLPGRVGVPYVNVSGGFALGNNFEGELPQTGNTFQWTDNYTKIFGKHTTKFGVDVRRQRFDQFLFFDVSGEYTVTSQATADEIASDGNFPSYPNYFLGAPTSYTQGAAQREDLRNTALYLFAQDSYKLKPNLTLNYGLRWELNTPYYDTGNRLQTFRPGQATTQYPCELSVANAGALGLTAGDCGQDTTNGNNAVFPLGLVFPGDKGVPRGLTSTYYKGFAPRIGLAWSPDATDGWIAKLTGGPGKMSVRAGFGLFYNPIEQLVLEQFSAEPPFGGSSFVSDPQFNLPYLTQAGVPVPNPFGGVINQTPQTPCAVNPNGPPGCVDWSNFRSSIYFGEFQPNLKSQYAEQYNLTIERQLTKDMLLRVSYVGTQAHHLLASYDINFGHAETCLGLNQLPAGSVLPFPGGPPPQAGTPPCGPFGSDSEYFIQPGTVIPQYAAAPGTPPTTCSGLTLPYNAAPGGSTCIPAGTTIGPLGVTLDGLRKYSSPNCQPLSGSNFTGCPSDGVAVFSNIFAEDTIANSNYNGLQISVEKNYSHGLLFQASYTFSKAIDQGASFENELNPLNFNGTRGLSLLDAKNRFVFSPVWDLPIPKYEGVKGKVANGWGASAIITYQSGFPIRVQDQNDSELMSSLFFEGANTPQVSGPITFTSPKNGPSNNNPNHQYVVGNFSDSNPGTFGNVPHALCCGAPINNTDLVISKKTPINERWNTEFRAEFYNAWNHTQFNNPDGNFTDSTFGQVLKVRESPRVMQFGLKFLF